MDYFWNFKFATVASDVFQWKSIISFVFKREQKLDERLKQKTTEIERIAYENVQLSEYIDDLKAKLQRSEG